MTQAQNTEQAEKTIQEHFQIFKKRFKAYSKSELIALLWNQGMQFRELQQIAKELHEENLKFKGETDENSK